MVELVLEAFDCLGFFTSPPVNKYPEFSDSLMPGARFVDTTGLPCHPGPVFNLVPDILQQIP